jgi:Uma2 family endonuclease
MSVGTEAITLLESGDRLARAEFHRRYLLRPDIKKAELVQGVVYVASPLRFTVHGEPQSLMNMWLRVYAAKTPGVRVGEDATVFLDDDSEVQPDVLLVWDPPRGGGARVTDDGYIEGPPHLVVEIAASSVSYDLHDKLDAYRRAGIPEYIVWRVLDGQIDWFQLSGGVYRRREPDAGGVIESQVFPGLRLAVERMLAGDAAAVLAAIGVQV